MRLIDVKHLGHERVIGCWQVDDVLVDPGPSSCLPTLLEALGEWRPRALLLTHIHLDHAGASGSLVERWPDLKVYVHEKGAPHMTEPSRLMESARRLYGPEMDRLWGEMTPVPERTSAFSRGASACSARSRLRTRRDTPPTTSPTYTTAPRSSATPAACESPPSLVVPPTPPPDIDVEAWHESIARIAAWRPRRLAITHFGDSEDVEAQLAELGLRLDAWGDLARTSDQGGFVTAIEEEIAAGTQPGWTRAFTQAAPPDQLYAGLSRYWRKRAEAPTRPASPPVS